MCKSTGKTLNIVWKDLQFTPKNGGKKVTFLSESTIFAIRQQYFRIFLEDIGYMKIPN